MRRAWPCKFVLGLDLDFEWREATEAFGQLGTRICLWLLCC